MSERRYKNWLVKASRADKEKIAQAKELAEKLNLKLPTAQLLVNRGCSDEKSAAEFLQKSTEQLHDPFLMKDMRKAAEKLLSAADDGRKTVIYGDYDVDGVTSVSILYMYLKEIGANVDYYIPSRLSDGYGLSEASLKNLKEQECSLIVTVDTGITAVHEAELIREMGMELIITDHHQCHSALPAACAIVNPKQPGCEYPFKELAGVGVVFKLLCAMELLRCPEPTVLDAIRRVCDKYLDLTAIGTVADVMPLRDENRLIVARGLSLIESSPRLSIEELLRAVNGEGKYPQKRKITSGFIGYTVAPRVNAAGRIKSASIAVELLLSDTREKASALAEELCRINVLRQQEENRIIEEAYQKIESEHDFRCDPVIVLHDEGWHHGVIGIVASRITEKYCRPCILVSFDGASGEKADGGDIGKGSGRSVKGMNLVEALTHCSDCLVKYGGHELAAGLSIKRDMLDAFKQKINDYARGCFDSAAPVPVLEAECELDGSQVTMDQAIELYRLEPFGVSNPVPVFVMYGMTVSSVSSVAHGKHTKLVLSKDSLVITAMYFRRSPEELQLFAGDLIDVMVNLDINEFQNTKSLQLIVKDIKPGESQLAEEERERSLYRKIKAGELDASELSDGEISEIIPARCDFAAVYNIIKRELRLGRETLSLRELKYLLSLNGTPLRYVKLKYILLVFSELNILGVEKVNEENEVYRFSYVYMKNKADLDKSNILRRLKSALIQKSGNTNV